MGLRGDQSSATGFEPRSLDVLGATTMGFIGLSVALWGVQFSVDVEWVQLWDRLEIERAAVGWPYPSGSAAERIAGEIDVLWYVRSGVATLQVVVFLLALVVFLIWLRRASKNLAGLVDLGWSPGAMVGLWFVPFLNLAVPPMVMSCLVRGSRAARAGDRAWEAQPFNWLVVVWWGAYLAGVAGALGGGYITTWGPVIADACFGVSGIALIALVAQVGSAQSAALSRSRTTVVAPQDGPSAALDPSW